MIAKKMPLRELFKALSPDGYNLCQVCKHGEPKGSVCSGGFYVSCAHPVERVREEIAGDVAGGDDCWAFRPRYNYETTVDVFAAMGQGDSWELVEGAK